MVKAFIVLTNKPGGYLFVKLETFILSVWKIKNLPTGSNFGGAINNVVPILTDFGGKEAESAFENHKFFVFKVYGLTSAIIVKYFKYLVF